MNEVRLLIDTHIWLWMHGAPENLSEEARQSLEEPTNEIIFSTVSAWEISIKHAIGKLTLPGPPLQYVQRRIAEDSLTVLPVHLDHALTAGTLPMHHRDPFDRLLIAQALIEKVALMSADEALDAYIDEGIDLVPG